MDNKHQKSQHQLALAQEDRGEASKLCDQGNVLSVALQPTESSSDLDTSLMEVICDRENLKKALAKVRQNKGAPGIDGMTVEELGPYLKEHWPLLKEQLLKGTYKPQPVRQVEIPKPDKKGTRKLGIPRVIDRFIQQAILQVLQTKIDPTFSVNSYGFRPRRSAHQAITKAQEYVAEGYGFVVDIDLEKFFDTVNHDKLMSEMAKRIFDKRLLKLLRAYLNVGVMQDGLVSVSKEGASQGGPLSPLLSNVVLDLLDKELERRGHRHCRYADDCNVYVHTERAGIRVMNSLKTFITKKLKLRVNEEKSAVARIQDRSFLGFSLTGGKTPKRRIAPKAIKRLKGKIREYTRAGKGMCMEKIIKDLGKYLRGWLAYYGHCQTPSVLARIESWIYRRLRCAYWRQWKRGKNRFKQLRRMGIGIDLAALTAGTNKGPWHSSRNLGVQMAMSKAYLKELGIPSLKCRTSG